MELRTGSGFKKFITEFENNLIIPIGHPLNKQAYENEIPKIHKHIMTNGKLHNKYRPLTDPIIKNANTIICDMDGTLYSECNYKKLIILSSGNEPDAWKAYMEFQKNNQISMSVSQITLSIMLGNGFWKEEYSQSIANDVANSTINVKLINELELLLKQGKKIVLSTLNLKCVAQQVAKKLGLNFNEIVGTEKNKVMSMFDDTFITNKGIFQCYAKSSLADNEQTILITDTGFDAESMKLPTIYVSNEHDIFSDEVFEHKPFLYSVNFGEETKIVR